MTFKSLITQMKSIGLCGDFRNTEYCFSVEPKVALDSTISQAWSRVCQTCLRIRRREKDLLALQAEDKSLRHITQMVNDCYSHFIPLFIKQVWITTRFPLTLMLSALFTTLMLGPLYNVLKQVHGKVIPHILCGKSSTGRPGSDS